MKHAALDRIRLVCLMSINSAELTPPPDANLDRFPLTALSLKEEPILT